MENGRKMERGKSGRAKVRNITLRPCEVSRCGGPRPARSEDGAVKPINACQFAGGTDVPISVLSACHSFGRRKWPMFGNIRCHNVLNR
jgi:hypothetical protein